MATIKWFLVRLTTWGFIPVMLLWLVPAMLLVAAATSGLLGTAQFGMWVMPLLLLGVIAGVLFIGWGKWMRERFVREGPLPIYPKRKLRQAFPHLTSKDTDLAERALRQFFVARVRGGHSKTVAMPSLLAERLWREFAADADAYKRWCATAWGPVALPTPAQALGPHAAANDALRRTWFWTCKEEAINPRASTRLPLLFALDAKLAVAGGIFYVTSSAAFGQMKKPQGQGDTGSVYFSESFLDKCYSGDCDNFGGADSNSNSSSDSDGGGDGGGGGGD